MTAVIQLPTMTNPSSTQIIRDFQQLQHLFIATLADPALFPCAANEPNLSPRSLISAS
jgi:hypothetical protein